MSKQYYWNNIRTLLTKGFTDTDYDPIIIDMLDKTDNTIGLGAGTKSLTQTIVVEFDNLKIEKIDNSIVGRLRSIAQLGRRCPTNNR
ncbi:MAG: hypothetical protein KDJ65_38830 [Anaerolineae bacterium]|nr:hypothetical protein [Anaerolineae bacterium]